MITAIRLRERNKKLNFLMRSYTTGQGTRFTAGEGTYPSAVRIITDARDIAEAQGIAQFEIIEAADERALAQLLRREMEGRARQGASPIPAQIVSEAPVAVAPPRAVVAALVTPTAIGAEEDEYGDELEDAPLPAPVPPEAPAPAPALPAKGKGKGRKGRG